jgi:Tol biopolymer transport system component
METLISWAPLRTGTEKEKCYMCRSMILKAASRSSAGARSRGQRGARRKHTSGPLAIVLLWLLSLAGCAGGTMQVLPPPNQPTTIAFNSSRALDGSAAANTNGNENIWAVKSDGTGVTPLTKLTAFNANSFNPVWSPDGSKMAFYSIRALDGSDALDTNSVFNIWVMKSDGTGNTPLTKLTAVNADSVGSAWSPDGSKIAFQAFRALDGSDAAGAENIWVVNADGTGAAPLTRLTVLTAQSIEPVWSPDGSKIAFASRRALDGSDAANTNNTFNIWVMKSDGTGAIPLTKLTASGALSSSPVWSPDGSKIAFHSARALDGSDARNTNGTQNIWAVKSDGTGATPLTRLTDLNTQIGAVVLSPDGSKIAFDSTRALDGSDAANTNFVRNIWVMGADGSAATSLTKLTVANSGSGEPVWSPDGGKIAFISQRALDGSAGTNTNSVFNIWVMSADGSAPVPLTKLTATNADSLSPGWKP